MIAYVAILVTAAAAYAGAPVWIALISASALYALSRTAQRRFAARFANIGSTQLALAAGWQTAGSALLASSAAYGFGRLSSMIL